MKTEKVILSFIAVLIGLLVAGIAFYFYQSSKTISTSQIKSISMTSPSPTPKPSIFLTLDTPIDEQVFDQKTIIVSGKTNPTATVEVLTTLSEQIVTPTSTGAFSTTVTIEDGENMVDIIAIAPNGDEVKLSKTVTFSTESF